ncbi:MAG: regulatory protein [Patescibacteria group bacterium]|nr:regulatory protein [Patescibacteria group bacterium]
MSTITDIKQQVKNPNKLSIFVDGKYSFSLTLDQLTDQKEVRVGKDIAEEELTRLKDLSKLTNHYIRMVSLIYARPRSEREIVTKLKLKKLEPEEIEELVAKLKKAELLNDQHFAEWWVEGRKNSKPISKRKLQNELSQKGIKADISQDVIANNFSEEDELESLKKLIEKKKDKYPDQQKLMAYLASKGFGYSIIKNALSDDDKFF